MKGNGLHPTAQVIIAMAKGTIPKAPYSRERGHSISAQDRRRKTGGIHTKMPLTQAVVASHVGNPILVSCEQRTAILLYISINNYIIHLVKEVRY